MANDSQRGPTKTHNSQHMPMLAYEQHMPTRAYDDP
jgi:hypothetical protein